MFRLAPNQYERIAAYFQDLAQVSVAAIFIPYFIESSDRQLALLGLALAILFWWAGLEATKLTQI